MILFSDVLLVGVETSVQPFYGNFHERDCLSLGRTNSQPACFERLGAPCVADLFQSGDVAAFYFDVEVSLVLKNKNTICARISNLSTFN